MESIYLWCSMFLNIADIHFSKRSLNAVTSENCSAIYCIGFAFLKLGLFQGYHTKFDWIR